MKRCECKVLFSLVVLMLGSVAEELYGETGSNSPYTRYGIGDIVEANSIANKAMGGVGYAIQSGNYNNPLNPASYVIFDTLTFTFDAGAGLSFANYKDAGKTERFTNGKLHHLTMRFPVARNVAVSAGLIPYSNMGYEYAEPKGDMGDNITYSGSGSLNQLYAGVAYRPVKGLSVGANFAYLFGEMTNSVYLNFQDTTTYMGYTINNLNIKSFKLDLGVQYTHPFSSSQILTMGFVFSPGWKTNSELSRIERKRTNQVDTAYFDNSRFDLPMNLGIGVCYRWNGKYALAGDVQIQNWEKAYYYDRKDTLKNRFRLALGFEYIPKIHDRSYWNNIRYRAGLSYDNLYYEVKGSRITDIGITAGVGLPLRLSRTFVNVALEYIIRRSENSSHLKENYFRINVGLSINEKWFMKRKFN